VRPPLRDLEVAALEEIYQALKEIAANPVVKASARAASSPQPAAVTSPAQQRNDARSRRPSSPRWSNSVTMVCQGRLRGKLWQLHHDRFHDRPGMPSCSSESTSSPCE